MRDRFEDRYGPWAVVAGASEGLGEAFARALASRGLNLVLIARREALLEELAHSLANAHDIQARPLPLDLASPEWCERLRNEVAGLEVGLGVYNAAYSPIGDFVERSLPELLRIIDVNVRGPVMFARTLAEPMIERKRGALVLMSSLAGNQGSPRLATYAASKAFNTILAEGLAYELRSSGVDVVTSIAGAIRTPGFRNAARKDAPGTLDASQVVERTLSRLGRTRRGRTRPGRGARVTPGAVNAMASFVMGRLLPRSTSVSIMASNTKELS